MTPDALTVRVYAARARIRAARAELRDAMAEGGEVARLLRDAGQSQRGIAATMSVARNTVIEWLGEG